MNASADAPKLGSLERLASSKAFGILFGFAMLLVAPVVVAGWGLTLLMLAPGGEWVWPLLPTAAGTLGVVGWIRAQQHVDAARSGGIDLTIACLAIGVAATLVPMGFAAALWIDAPYLGSGPWVATVFAAAHFIVAVRAMGWMQRLARHHAASTGEGFDSLPLLFLLIAVALAVVALTISLTLLEPLP
jgi:hypothetical protein